MKQNGGWGGSQRSMTRVPGGVLAEAEEAAAEAAAEGDEEPPRVVEHTPRVVEPTPQGS